jgi:short-subunit dehydrogenase
MQNPKHILITGASSGIGAALAHIYAASDIRLSLHGRDSARLDRVALTARGLGAKVFHQTGDVTMPGSMALFVQDAAREQPIDLVIANAGVSLGSGTGVQSFEEAQRIFAVNLHGVLNTILPAIPIMMARKEGQIAIISSIASFRGFAGASAYCSSKATVRIYGEALRAELLSHGVGVSVVCPGYVRTPMTAVNKVPMPFLMSAEKAAGIIKTGLVSNPARLTFPWQLYWGLRIANLLPQDILNRLMWKMPKKSGAPIGI